MSVAVSSWCWSFQLAFLDRPSSLESSVGMFFKCNDEPVELFPVPTESVPEQVDHAESRAVIEDIDKKLKRKQYEKEWYENRKLDRKAKGLCIRCGEPVNGAATCRECLDKTNERRNKLVEEGKCVQCAEVNDGPYRRCSKCRVKYNARAVEEKITLKKDALDAYGGPKCRCCGDERIEALTIDHIRGGGNEHREEVSCGSGGHTFYRWLKDSDYPEGFQVLCFSCNLVKYLVGAESLDQIPPHTEVVSRSGASVPVIEYDPFTFPV